MNKMNEILEDARQEHEKTMEGVVNGWLDLLGPQARADFEAACKANESAAADLEILHAMQLCEKHNACPPLVGVKEFAAILGLRYQYVQSRLKRLKDGYTDARKGTLSSIPFPAPVAELACGPVWLRAQAVAYKEAREGSPIATDVRRRRNEMEEGKDSAV